MEAYRKGYVYIRDILAGIIEETDSGYLFKYDPGYLSSENPHPVSLTLPLREEAYESNVFFPYFDGLIPEGWVLEQAVRNWKLDIEDRFGVMLLACKDPIGAISISKEERK